MAGVPDSDLPGDEIARPASPVPFKPEHWTIPELLLLVECCLAQIRVRSTADDPDDSKDQSHLSNGPLESKNASAAGQPKPGTPAAASAAIAEAATAAAVKAHREMDQEMIEKEIAASPSSVDELDFSVVCDGLQQRALRQPPEVYTVDLCKERFGLLWSAMESEGIVVANWQKQAQALSDSNKAKEKDKNKRQHEAFCSVLRDQLIRIIDHWRAARIKELQAVAMLYENRARQALLEAQNVRAGVCDPYLATMLERLQLYDDGDSYTLAPGFSGPVPYGTVASHGQHSASTQRLPRALPMKHHANVRLPLLDPATNLPLEDFGMAASSVPYSGEVYRSIPEKPSFVPSTADFSSLSSPLAADATAAAGDTADEKDHVGAGSGYPTAVGAVAAPASEVAHMSDAIPQANISASVGGGAGDFAGVDAQALGHQVAAGVESALAPTAPGISHMSQPHDSVSNVAVHTNSVSAAPASQQPPATAVKKQKLAQGQARVTTAVEMEMPAEMNRSASAVAREPESSAAPDEEVIEEVEDEKSNTAADAGEDTKTLMSLYNQVCAHEYAPPFEDPITEEIAPRYFSKVSMPMDLKTVQARLKNGTIRSAQSLFDHFSQIFCNAKTYNTAKSKLYKMAHDYDVAVSKMFQDVYPSRTEDFAPKSAPKLVLLDAAPNPTPTRGARHSSVADSDQQMNDADTQKTPKTRATRQTPASKKRSTRKR